ncbi:sulfurtransferase TusA family protein [Alkalibaculum sporogenes]|nr:sulfurtransferase TusA family protein [Alkalibaculum sporogenes]
MANIKTLNLYDERCTPILTKTIKELSYMNTNDVLVLNTDNHCALKKVRNLCEERGYHVEIEKLGINDMRYTIRV